MHASAAIDRTLCHQKLLSCQTTCLLSFLQQNDDGCMLELLCHPFKVSSSLRSPPPFDSAVLLFGGALLQEEYCTPLPSSHIL